MGDGVTVGAGDGVDPKFMYTQAGIAARTAIAAMQIIKRLILISSLFRSAYWYTVLRDSFSQSGYEYNASDLISQRHSREPLLDGTKGRLSK